MARRIKFEVVVSGKNGYKLFDHPCLVLQALPFISVCIEYEKMVSVYVDIEPMRYGALYSVEKEAGFLYYVLDKFTGDEEPKTYIRKITVVTKTMNEMTDFIYEVEIEGGFFGKASAVARTMKTMLVFEKPRIRTYLSRTIRSLTEARRKEENMQKTMSMQEKSGEKKYEEKKIEKIMRGEIRMHGYKYDLCDPLVRYRIIKSGRIVASIKSRTDKIISEVKSYSSRGGVYYVAVSVRDAGGKKWMYLLVELGEVLGFCNEGVDVNEVRDCTAMIYEVDKEALKQIS